MHLLLRLEQAAVISVLTLRILQQLYTLFSLLAPTPRPPRPSEKQYLTILPNGGVSQPQPLPCWYDNHVALKEMARKGLMKNEEAYQGEAGECFMSVVVPAFNEEKRLSGMLEEAVEYLQATYGHHGTKSKSSSNGSLQASGQQGDPRRGWEIIVVSDGSTDKTVQTALYFAKTHQSNKHATQHGPWNEALRHGNIPSGSIRVVQLEKNRGKGGAVTHGMRHARGTYVVFADADGASKFEDLGKLVVGCEKAKDKQGRAVGVGSRAHMVGTEAVVKVHYLSTIFILLFTLLIIRTALLTEKHTHARIPPPHSYAHYPNHCSHQRHPMWLQTLQSAITTLHHPVHALRRLDIRRRNAYACRDCRDSDDRGARGLEGGRRQ